MNVALLTNDLMVVSRVEGAVQRFGASVNIASADAVPGSTFDAEATRLVLVDLSTPGLDVNSLVEQVKATGRSGSKIVAFGPHVHASLLSAARDAGCDEVISRGEFFARLDAILSRALR
jgi:DNA-binding response OmpR family regulator